MAGAAVATAAAAAASTAAVAAAAVAAKAAATSETGPVAQSCLWLHGLSWLGLCFHARLICGRMDGRRLVEYKVLREIGRGSFGKVCLARAYTAERERQHVAVKFAREAASVEDMRTEHNIMCALAHPNVIGAIDFLCEGDMNKVSSAYRSYKVALVMEPASSDLAAFLEVHGPCRDAGLTRAWCMDVAKAVAHMRGQGVVHRDIKPANLLVCLDGGSVKSDGFIRARIKLSDIGCARLLPRGPKKKHRWQEGHVPSRRRTC